jgi:hypothetical protein
MGWWSTDILGGDTPYDVAGELELWLGLQPPGSDDSTVPLHMPDNWSAEERVIVADAIDDYDGTKLLTALRKVFTDESSVIATQVLGLLVISSGADMSDDLRKAVLDACQRDQWAKEDSRRTRKIAAFAALVKDYDGTPVAIKQRGLLEMMCGAEKD